MKIIKSGNQDWQEGADYYKKVLFEADNITSGGFLVQEVRVKPNAKAMIHHHKNQSELFYAINNYGFFIVNEENIKLEAGDMLLVEPGEKNSVGNECVQEYKILAMKLNYEQGDIMVE